MQTGAHRGTVIHTPSNKLIDLWKKILLVIIQPGFLLTNNWGGLGRCLTKFWFVATLLTLSEAMLIEYSLGWLPRSPAVDFFLVASASVPHCFCLRVFSSLFWRGLPLTKKRDRRRNRHHAISRAPPLWGALTIFAFVYRRQTHSSRTKLCRVFMG